MSKKLLAAGLVRDLEFDKPFDCWIYLFDLDKRGVRYQLIEKCRLDGGRVLLRLIQAYNDSEIIQLYDGQRSLFHAQQLDYCRSHYDSDGFIYCGNCMWVSVCPRAHELKSLEYCEYFDSAQEVNR